MTDCDNGSQAKVLKAFKVFPFRSESDLGQRPRSDFHYIHLTLITDAVYIYVLPWSDFPIVYVVP